jgi:DNA-directed RNA polymerase specialized sigma subunit
VQGYVNIWPAIIRQSWEAQDADDHRTTRFPPTGKAVDAMLETMKWILVLDEQDRHVVWCYAQGVPRKVIANKLGIGRTTLHRRHASALQRIADHLNDQRAAA